MIVATTTLAQGSTHPPRPSSSSRKLNHPPEAASPPIPVAEYKNIVGQAGRLGFATSSQAFLLVEGPVDEERKWHRYLVGTPEDVHSTLLDLNADTLTLVPRALGRHPAGIWTGPPARPGRRRVVPVTQLRNASNPRRSSTVRRGGGERRRRRPAPYRTRQRGRRGGRRADRARPTSGYRDGDRSNRSAPRRLLLRSSRAPTQSGGADLRRPDGRGTGRNIFRRTPEAGRRSGDLRWCAPGKAPARLSIVCCVPSREVAIRRIKRAVGVPVVDGRCEQV